MKNEEPPNATPESRREAIREFYRLVGESAPPAWSGQSLAIHFGLETNEPFSLEESLVETNRELARRAHIHEGSRVLDAGCGIGGSSLWLARELGAVVTGISIVAEQIAQAERLARESNTNNVQFFVGDFMATGLPAQSFDVVWNLESLCHCHDPASYFVHAFDLLADEGRIACFDVFLAESQSTLPIELLDGGAFGDIQRPSAITTMLQRAGFVDIEVIDVRERVLRSVTMLRDLAHQAWLRERMRQALFGVDTTKQQEHAKASVACADGVLSGTLTYAYVGARRTIGKASGTLG